MKCYGTANECISVKHLSEVELIYKNKVKPSERPLVKSSKECYNYYYKPGMKTRLNL